MYVCKLNCKFIQIFKSNFLYMIVGTIHIVNRYKCIFYIEYFSIFRLLLHPFFYTSNMSTIFSLVWIVWWFTHEESMFNFIKYMCSLIFWVYVQKSLLYCVFYLKDLRFESHKNTYAKLSDVSFCFSHIF